MDAVKTLGERVANPPPVKPKTRWQVLDTNLMITPDPPKAPVTDGGIALPDTVRLSHDNTGVIVGIGAACTRGWTLGDHIMFMDYGGCEVTLHGKTYLLLSEDTVVAREEVIDGPACTDSPVR